jgi:transcriptional regulator PpsR
VRKFSGAKKWLGDLDTETASSLITAATDIALVVNGGADGVIRDVAFGSDELEGDFGGEPLVGKTWAESVTAESRPKVESILRDALAKSPPRWRHVNHLLPNGSDVPVMYAAMQVGARGRIVALGRGMRQLATTQQRLIEAQRSMEQEYSRLRQAETRHRLLFQVASEAVLVVDASNRKVIEANPAAGGMLGEAGRRIVGRPITEPFDSASRRVVETLLGAVATTGHSEEFPVRSSGESARALRIAASLFREGRSAYFLVRLLPGEVDAESAELQKKKSRVMELIDGAPDGFVVTDMQGRVLLANRSFLDAVQLATEEQVKGQPLDRWMARPGVDFTLLANQLREHHTLRLFATKLRGEYGSLTDVEICAVSVPDSAEPCCGFTIRDVGQRLQSERRATVDRPRSVEQLTELVGRVPLKELVRESTDMIERLCIEAALELTGDNRASAAEILGLSRQSLYAKLHRHGLADIGAEASAAES